MLPKGMLALKKEHDRSSVVAACLSQCSSLNPNGTIAAEKRAQQIDETHRKPAHLQPALVSSRAPFLCQHQPAACGTASALKAAHVGSFASPTMFT